MLTTLQRSRSRHGAAYVEHGTGEPLVLIHGVGMRLEAWAPQIEALAATPSGHRGRHAGPWRKRPPAAMRQLADFVAWLGGCSTISVSTV